MFLLFCINLIKLEFYNQSPDELQLLPDGKLRHYIKHSEDENDFQLKHLEHDEPPVFYDYKRGHYCMDKVNNRCDLIINTQLTKSSQSISSSGEMMPAQFAMVCTPEKVIHWTDTDFLLRKIVNPICHGISMIVLLVIAIIYFVLPTLR